MDTSKKYILMCAKAKEIQKRKPEKGDFFGWPETDVIEVDVLNEMLMTVLFGDNTYFETVAIWLPRQDQLQEILLADPDNRFNTSICYITLVCNFAKFCGIFDEDEEGRSNIALRKESLEVLWFAFVMKEKYNKTWDGEKWIKGG